MTNDKIGSEMDWIRLLITDTLVWIVAYISAGSLACSPSSPLGLLLYCCMYLLFDDRTGLAGRPLVPGPRRLSGSASPIDFDICLAPSIVLVD